MDTKRISFTFKEGADENHGLHFLAQTTGMIRIEKCFPNEAEGTPPSKIWIAHAKALLADHVLLSLEQYPTIAFAEHVADRPIEYYLTAHLDQNE